VIPVLPMVLEEPGKTDLFGKLKEHELEHNNGGHFRQRSWSAAGGVMSVLVCHRWRVK
jgi:hypothetical protein